MLVLALAGLLVMHGLDAGAITRSSGGEAATSHPARHRTQSELGRDDRTGGMHGPARSEQSMSPLNASVTAEARTDDGAGHVGWGHVVAMCVAVLATMVTGAVRRLLASARSRITARGASVAGGLVRLPRVFRPPGPARIELCVLTC